MDPCKYTLSFMWPQCPHLRENPLIPNVRFILSQPLHYPCPCSWTTQTPARLQGCLLQVLLRIFISAIITGLNSSSTWCSRLAAVFFRFVLWLWLTIFPVSSMILVCVSQSHPHTSCSINSYTWTLARCPLPAEVALDTKYWLLKKCSSHLSRCPYRSLLCSLSCVGSCWPRYLLWQPHYICSKSEQLDVCPQCPWCPDGKVWIRALDSCSLTLPALLTWHWPQI